MTCMFALHRAVQLLLAFSLVNIMTYYYAYDLGAMHLCGLLARSIRAEPHLLSSCPLSLQAIACKALHDTSLAA